MDDLNPSKIGQLFVNCLAILGGFLVGYLFTAMLANRVSRRRPPTKLNQSTRFLGGVALAVLIGIIVFGHGQGWTLFGGGADGSSNQNGEPQPISAPHKEPVADNTPRIRVTLLGGTDVKAEKFYLIDDDAEPRTLSETTPMIQKKKDATPNLVLEIRFSERNVLPEEHPAVTRLKRAARQIGLVVLTVSPGI